MVPDRKLRGYWGIVLAVGVAVSTHALADPAGKEAAQTQAEDKGSSANVAAALPEKEPERPDYHQDACYNAQSHDDADLCAQWRAAVAAEKAADAAQMSNKVAIFAAVLAFLGTLGVVIALGLARNANRIARDMGQRQIRAYVQLSHVDCIPIGARDDLGHRIGFNMRFGFVNKGSTPGRDCWCALEGGVLPPDTWPLRVRFRNGQVMHGGSIIGPETKQYAADWFVPMNQMVRVVEGHDWLIFSGRADYLDVFGEPRFTEICVHLDPICDLAYLDAPTINAERMFVLVFTGPNNRGN